MRLKIFYLITVAVTVLITAVFVVFADGGQDDENIRFLNDFGWEIKPVRLERVTVKLPEKIDDVYSEYNKLQKEAGLDIEPYMGKKCIRYTYEVLNYPYEIDEQIRANVLVCGNKIIAGDIMTVSVNGFMHGLKNPYESKV